MGDRNNPIKFGPEWLRNLSRERSTGSSASNTQNVNAASGSATSPGATGSGGATGSPSGATATSPTAASLTNTAATTNQSPKVQLAKLRYGREEMLALYDRTSEAPSELKYIELLYQPRGKPPFALNNTFEDDMRDNMRGGPMGGMSPGDRFGMGRGMGRGLSVSEGRGRPRVPFVRQPSAGRGVSWHLGASPRTPGYGNAVDDDVALQSRSWSNSNSGNTTGRSSGEQSEWTPNKMFRSKRQGNNTNWRQPISREEGEEWRSPEPGRSRSNQDKWEREWGDRPTQDKQQSWNSNRRTWVGGDTQNNDENLPEWAVENAEACGGTFDSSGAFHGYSNDDSNLPKSQESSYALARSHTHGNFSRTKTAEEGSEEWWASEKAKKLSPKRFDASDIKFKKQISTGVPETNSGNGGGSNSNSNKDDKSLQELPEKLEKSSGASEPPENNTGGLDDEKFKKNAFKSKFNESKTFGSLMRSDINIEEASDERGNFQSVMITTNNALRQKHQNIVSSANDNISKQNRKPGLLHLIQNSSASQSGESEHGKQHQSQEEKIVEEIFDMTLEDKDLMSKMPQSPIINPSSGNVPTGMPTAVNTMIQMPNSGMQMNSISPGLPVQGLNMNSKPNMTTSGMQVPGMPSSGMQPVGITNSALNASLGLPLGPGNSPMGMTLQGVPPPVLTNTGMTNPAMAAGGMQGNMGAIQAGATGMPGFPPGGGIQAMAGANVPNASLFLGQNSNNSQMPPPNGGQPNMFPMHGLPHSGSQNAFGPSIYSNMMQSPPTPANPNSQNLADQWYYEDPKKIIQGPFCSKEMYGWYRAGFFSPSLMVRRACDSHMRPLGSYGPVVPFAQMDMLSSFPLSAGFEPRNQGPHESMLNPQQSLGLDVMSNMNLSEAASIDSLQFGTVGLMRNPPFGQQQMVDSLWSQPSPSPEILWMQQNMSGRNENRVNNLPMFFWDQQPSAITSNALLPEEIAKEMKTEDQILAQLRASQNASQNLHFRGDQSSITTSNKPREEDNFPPNNNTTPNLEELQKLIQKDTLTANAVVTDDQKDENEEKQTIAPEKAKVEQTVIDSNVVKPQQPQLQQQPPLPQQQPQPQLQQQQPQPQQQQQQQQQQQPQQKNTSVESKTSKSVKSEKESKNKENNSTKNKNKKSKEEKKDEVAESKHKQDDIVKKRSEEPSPTKSKKEEKISKKELEREKKELIKEGFTIVKSEKNANKENKKKAEEAKVAEEAERKRKEEEKLTAEEEKKRKQAEAPKKVQAAAQETQQRPATEAVVKKSPWSAVANQSLQATSKDGMTLTEIQRLEREKKLEQMKEQQQMMQIIAQQQAAALAREQEMQAGLGWAKKKGTNFNTPGQSLVEIQAEARKQAAAAAAAATQANEETNTAPQPTPVPWSNTQNGVGFWDTQPSQSKAEKPQETSKVTEQKPKKKQVTLISPVKKNTSPVIEFEAWCTSVLRHWKDSIDVPTFVSFLKDIESPYEVKDYVKCYLGENKETSDFARQFLERRSKLLRVGMVTPSDDLSSPAMAVIPRTTSNSDYQEVKGKGKKTKKNKMLKIDARILGFSVTAAEDRINVGDIDTV